MDLELEITEREGNQIIRVKGEIDLYSSPRLRDIMLTTIPKAKAAIAVDLANVGYMDSSGVATLVEGLKAAGKKKKNFVLLSPSPPVMKVLQLSRLDSVFTIQQ